MRCLLSEPRDQFGSPELVFNLRARHLMQALPESSQGDRWMELMAVILVETGSSGFRKSLFQNSRWKAIEGIALCHTRTCTRKHAHARTRAHTHTHARTRTHTHTCTHTHTHTAFVVSPSGS